MNQLGLFRATLPTRPMATDDFSHGLYRIPKVEALTKRYIQANPKNYLKWMPFDIDHPGGAYIWEFLEAPAPNISVENPENRHAHLLYCLDLPVIKNPAASIKALRFAAMVEDGLRRKLDADVNYTGFTVKNPLALAWNVQVWQESPYDLYWLSDFVDIRPYRDKRKRLPDYGTGRNVTLFENLRRWAYKSFNKYASTEAAWKEAVLKQAITYNTFSCPLPYHEVKSTAKSVSGWTWSNFIYKNYSSEEFSKLQAERARYRWRDSVQKKYQIIMDFNLYPSGTVQALTGIPSRTIRRIRAREEQYTEEALATMSHRLTFFRTMNEHPDLTREDIAARIGVSRRTVERALQINITNPILDNSLYSGPFSKIQIDYCERSYTIRSTKTPKALHFEILNLIKREKSSPSADCLQLLKEINKKIWFEDFLNKSGWAVPRQRKAA